MIWKLASRNLLNHKTQTIVVGSIVFFGSFMSVLGSSVLDSVSNGIRRSITQSIAGDAQIWSAEKDIKFSVFGDSQTNDFPDIGQIPDFPAVEKAILESVPNVKSVVPQGINLALMNPNTVLDRLLADLRANPNMEAQKASDLKEHVRILAKDLGASYERNIGGFLRVNEEERKASREAVAQATSNTFWENFEKNRNDSLEFLENKIAPLSSNDALSFFYYVGTTPDKMLKAFPLIEIVKGESIPPGQRGFLFNEYVYEKQIKHKTAVRLDTIRNARIRDKETIAQSKKLQQKVKENVLQAADIYNQISPRAAQELVPVMQQFLGSKETTLTELMPKFLDLDDSNFESRYEFFYSKIAPLITLYRMKVGDVFPITAVSRSGSPNSVNVKLWGIFRFRSIENSPVSGYFSIMDLITFRQLYGHMTPERRAETDALNAEMAKELSNNFDSNNVDAMFSQKVTETNSTQQTNNAPQTWNPSEKLNRDGDTLNRTYSVEEMENGVTPNAAIVLHDPQKLDQTLVQIRDLFKKRGWKLNAGSWLDVSGALGQLAFVIRAILYLFLGVVYFVGAFIVANAVLMSTLQRTREIGVIRAIGGQRGFVRRLIVGEVFLMSGIFGALGIICSLALVAWLGYVGIPAPNEILEFVFSGPKLHLTASFTSVVVSYLVAIAVSVLASLYPVAKAVRVPPVTAMRAD
jgi:ABC-type lipoprotein release transport system permease subunit